MAAIAGLHKLRRLELFHDGVLSNIDAMLQEEGPPGAQELAWVRPVHTFPTVRAFLADCNHQPPYHSSMPKDRCWLCQPTLPYLCPHRSRHRSPALVSSSGCVHIYCT